MENNRSVQELPEQEELTIKKGLPITKLQSDVSKFHVWDKVLIPTFLLPSDSTVEKGEYVDATIEAIYKHHIVYRMQSGIRISLDYFDSLQIIVKEAFSSYPEEQQLMDLVQALSNT